jgi:hypothetical protein
MLARVPPSPHVLDMRDLEVDDGPALARLVSRLRALVEEHGALELHACPQLLAHTLYKAGLLRSGRIRLISVRDEEPYG